MAGETTHPLHKAGYTFHGPNECLGNWPILRYYGANQTMDRNLCKDIEESRYARADRKMTGMANNIPSRLMDGLTRDQNSQVRERMYEALILSASRLVIQSHRS